MSKNILSILSYTYLVVRMFLFAEKFYKLLKTLFEACYIEVDIYTLLAFSFNFITYFLSISFSLL